VFGGAEVGLRDQAQEACCGEDLPSRAAITSAAGKRVAVSERFVLLTMEASLPPVLLHDLEACRGHAGAEQDLPRGLAALVLACAGETIWLSFQPAS
jgi:hypothetical protein